MNFIHSGKEAPKRRILLFIILELAHSEVMLRSFLFPCTILDALAYFYNIPPPLLEPFGVVPGFPYKDLISFASGAGVLCAA